MAKAKGKTAFVTGASGFLGLNLVEELLEQGWRVVGMHRANSDIRLLSRFPVECVVGDITDYKSVRDVMPKNVDAVFHVAANPSVWSRSNVEQFKVNVKGTRHVVRAALEMGAKRFVHNSSIMAYGLHGGVITEETPTRGNAAKINYVRSKALAEREVRHGISRGLKAVIVNPSNIIGAYDTQNWVRLFQLLAYQRLPAVPPGGGSFCHARAVARAQVAAAQKGRVGANYLLGGVEISYRKLVQEMARMLGRRGGFTPLPPPLLTVYAHLEEWIAPLFGRQPDMTRDAVSLMSINMYCSSKRAIQELDYQPQPLERMLHDCHQWMVSAGLLKKV